MIVYFLPSLKKKIACQKVCVGKNEFTSEIKIFTEWFGLWMMSIAMYNVISSEQDTSTPLPEHLTATFWIHYTWPVNGTYLTIFISMEN